MMCAAAAAVTVVWFYPPKASRGRARAAAPTTSANGIDYVFRWDRLGRKGQRCRVTVRGAMNSCRLVFDDGHTIITSRNAIGRAPCPA